MMTGTAAATFPISSSVCMIFLIRAWEGGRQLGPRRLSQNGALGRARGVSRENGGGGHRRGEGTKGGGASGSPNTAMRPPPQRGLGPSLPGAGSTLPGPGHVLTGGNRALYFFFLLGISGSLSPCRAQRRRSQPPGPGAC